MAALKNVDLPAEGFPKEQKHWQTDHITIVSTKTHTPPQEMLIYASKAKLNSTHPSPSLISSHPIQSHLIPSHPIPKLISSHCTHYPERKGGGIKTGFGKTAEIEPKLYPKIKI